MSDYQMKTPGLSGPEWAANCVHGYGTKRALSVVDPPHLPEGGVGGCGCDGRRTTSYKTVADPGLER